MHYVLDLNAASYCLSALSTLISFPGSRAHIRGRVLGSSHETNLPSAFVCSEVCFEPLLPLRTALAIKISLLGWSARRLCIAAQNAEDPQARNW